MGKRLRREYRARNNNYRDLAKPIVIEYPPGVRVVTVYVESYDDIAFWRGVFEEYVTPKLAFNVSVPPRKDLAKGKKVLIGLADQSSEDLLLCMDSDFDYLFNDQTAQSRIINRSPYLFHTHAYAIENLLCYAPNLHKICVKATKSDAPIMDFERFMADYSKTIYPLFLWYAYSAQANAESVFTLMEFRISVKINYLDLENNGANTLEWLDRQVNKRLDSLRNKYPEITGRLPEFEKILQRRGVTPENVYLFMQGHTLMDNVVLVMLSSVCNQLKIITMEKILSSGAGGEVLRNEVNAYNNSLRNVRDVLLDNEDYKDCFLFKELKKRIERYIASLQ